jgi:hypothetical protein
MSHPDHPALAFASGKMEHQEEIERERERERARERARERESVCVTGWQVR